MKKLLALVLSLLFVPTLLAGCGGASSKANVFVINGPSGIACVNMWNNAAYNFTAVGTPDDITAKLISGEADIAAVPTNLAASLYAKTNGGVTLLAVTMGSVLYMVENGDTVQSFADLAGKTIYTTGQGANPEYILRYLLTAYHIDATLSFVADNDTLTAMLASGQAAMAMAAEPVVSAAMARNPALRVAADIGAVWDAVCGTPLLMSCVAARTDYVKAHPVVIRNFLKALKTSISLTADVPTTAARCVQYGIIPNQAVAESAIPRCHLAYYDGDPMRVMLNGYLQVLYDANPSSIGGSMPDTAFYYKQS